ncbi:MAG: S-layer homology domain-containing protein, partial [Clostridia bacterium]|nr:S-layer homology domain-containing protein [Clostridia bacterium]
EGEPATTAVTPFTDLKAGWYKKSVAWAYENKVVNGTTDTTFSPTTPITREQIATIFYRFAQFKGRDISARANLNTFPDGSKVAKYAKEAMTWAVGEGLITGTKSGSQTLLDPKGNATRAQVATILMRYLESEPKSLQDKIDAMLDKYLCVTHGDINIQFGYTGATVTEENMANILKKIARLDDRCTVTFDDFITDIKEEYQLYGDGQYVPIGELDVTFADPETEETVTVPIKFSIRKILPSGAAGFPNGALGICPEDRNPEFVEAGRKLGAPAVLEERKVYAYDGEFTEAGIESFFRNMTGLTDAETYPFCISEADLAQIAAGEPFYASFVDKDAPDGRADMIWVRAVLQPTLESMIENRISELECAAHGNVYFIGGTSSTVTPEALGAAIGQTFGCDAEILDGFEDFIGDYQPQGNGITVGGNLEVLFTRGEETYTTELQMCVTKQIYFTYTGAQEGCALGYCWDDVPMEIKTAITVMDSYENGSVAVTSEQMNAEYLETFFRQETGLTDSIYAFYSSEIGEDGKVNVCFRYVDPVTGQVYGTGAVVTLEGLE